MDDDNSFSLGSFNYYKNKLVSLQNNGTAFQIYRYCDSFQKVFNRTTDLTLNRYSVRLETSCSVTLRSSAIF